jgi:hypothetical protein
MDQERYECKKTTNIIVIIMETHHIPQINCEILKFAQKHQARMIKLHTCNLCKVLDTVVTAFFSRVDVAQQATQRDGTDSRDRFNNYEYVM